MHWMKIWLDIAEGRWKYNGEPISFGTNGALLNGQHRLKRAPKVIPRSIRDVIFGLDPEAMSTIDIGKVRTAANIAHLEGIQNASVVAARPHTSSCCTRTAASSNSATSRSSPAKRRSTSGSAPITGSRTSPDAPPVWAAGLASPRVMAFCYYLFSAQKSRTWRNSSSTGWRAAPAYESMIPFTCCGSVCAPTARERRSCRSSKSWRCSSRRGPLTGMASGKVPAMEQQRRKSREVSGDLT